MRRSKALPEGGNLRNEILTPLAARLHRAVQLAGDIGELRRDRTAGAIGESLELLAECGLARYEKATTGGRPAETWFANA